MTGRIHSIETFGTVDGPGIRLVVFLKGCPMRCLYCHNPDTWDPSGGREMESGEIIRLFERNRPFYRNGGITATGGEPLLQMDFLTELFEQAAERGIHTCIDTSGVVFQKENTDYITRLDRLLHSTDLVLLDIKQIDPEQHMKLTGHSNEPVLALAAYLDQKNIPVWIRHVVTPGLTDNPDSLYRLGYFIGGLKNIKALEVLPYHTMGITKYEQLGLSYPLGGVPEQDPQALPGLKAYILKGIRDRRNTP